MTCVYIWIVLPVPVFLKTMRERFARISEPVDVTSKHYRGRIVPNGCETTATSEANCLFFRVLNQDVGGDPLGRL